MGFECCTFKAQWNVDYFVIKLDVKALCLLCNDTIVVLKKKVQYTSLSYQAFDTVFPPHRSVTEKLGNLKLSILPQ